MADSILAMAKGAIMERADYEMSRILENIMDVNTMAAKKRVLTITLELTPDAMREKIRVSCVSKSKLEPTNAVETSLFLTPDEDGEICAVEMVPQVPGQTKIGGGEQEDAKVFKLIERAV